MFGEGTYWRLLYAMCYVSVRAKVTDDCVLSQSQDALVDVDTHLMGTE